MVGEYVVEILRVIQENLPHLDTSAYVNFVCGNRPKPHGRFLRKLGVSLLAHGHIVVDARLWSHAPGRLASFENPYDPYGSGYSANARRTATFVALRTEPKAITKKRFRPPGDGRFFDGHH